MARDLRPLFDPRSVAIVGASDDPAKWGNWLGRGALRGEHRRPVYLVNRNGGTVLGRTAHRSLADLPGAPELVVVAVPAAAFEQAVDDALAAGARALIGITSGLGELGAEAGLRERALVERVRAAGAVLLGPNCLGVYDAGSDLGLASNEFPPGTIGLASQSGNLALELGILARQSGLGFSRFASIGNQADVDIAELVAAFADHALTEVIAVYAEDFRDGRAFVDAAAGAGKPVVLLTVGASEASARAAHSHTGALVSDMAVVAAAARAAGAHLVQTPHELIDLVQALVRTHPLRGPRIAVLGDGGGHGAIACDVAAAAGLELPRLSDALAADLAAQLPHTAATRNPVDLAGGGEQDFYSYARVSGTLLHSGEVDGLLLTGYFGGYSQYSEDFSATEVGRRPADRGCGDRGGAADGRPLDVRRLADVRRPARRPRPGLHLDRGRGAGPCGAAGAAARRGRAAVAGRPDGPGRAGLLRQPGAARGGGHPVCTGRARTHARRGACGRRRPRLPGGREGRRRAAQVRRRAGWWWGSPTRWRSMPRSRDWGPGSVPRGSRSSEWRRSTTGSS